jgi:cysteine desulfurase
VVLAVADAMERYPGNPSSAHAPGAAARRALESARESVAAYFGAKDLAQVVFTSSGTESINTALSLLAGPSVTQIVTSTTDHSAVLLAAIRWASGRPVRRIRVSGDGALDLDDLAHCTAEAPSLVSVALANNETGVISDIHAISQACRRHGALLHVDAVQAAGKIPFRLNEIDCDAASLSAHKFHGPPGCGILFLRSSIPHDARGRGLLPGHQENGLRGGTENLPAIVGTVVGVEALRGCTSALAKVGELRDRLEHSLLMAIPGSDTHGRGNLRLPNTISLYCPQRNATDLVSMLSQMGVAVSSGAACTTGSSPSHVIQAMGFPKERANGTLRLSLSRFTTAEEVDEATRLIIDCYFRTLASVTCE